MSDADPLFHWWSVYDTATGLFTGARYAKDEAFARMNTPAGCDIAFGEFDPLEWRVDLSTGTVVSYQPPAPPDDELRTWSWDVSVHRWIPAATDVAVAMDVRASRGERLAACDWIVARAVEWSEPVPPSWSAYRQALRDITAQPGFPRTVVWPEPPEA